MASTMEFRPSPEDERVIASVMREGEGTADVVRRALRLLEREQWLERARSDAGRLVDEDLGTEANAW
ncbi:hypothetical protein AB0J21_19210 [Streptomyces sp. NPDC049954]|uniref:hypothetical protein n=1 Tax=Streptomyces sp. NPDC049954 TaxID=3155779 RepID=UPI00341AA63F